ncbi:hypothetical protein PoB_006040200 [Plakobranchus ocellatus]|uniref:Uncharacterized protein n=1 Tax=Plakobranchus ocellatus TaxID=259542 RepID=A0AAV4CPU7_9GAST|nr:hypothetical protein PoB_006040200 [Plakobranchus ocellatus]
MVGRSKVDRSAPLSHIPPAVALTAADETDKSPDMQQTVTVAADGRAAIAHCLQLQKTVIIFPVDFTESYRFVLHTEPDQGRVGGM